jgi:hypothetical protein
MNNPFFKRTRILVICLFLFSSGVFAQFKDIDFLRSAPADGAKFLQAYLSPYANAFGSGLSGGWYNTAKPHKLGGFDITVSTSVGIVPSSAASFDISGLGLTTLTGSGMTPTVAGPKTAGPPMTYRLGGVTLAAFNAPKGTDWKYIPVPTAQVGIGLPLGTELKFRFVPKIKINDGDISLWGVGILHSIMQYIPGNKLTPFDVSVFAGYTQLQGNVPLGLEPDPSVGPSAYVTYNPATAFNDQNLNIKVKSLNVSAIGSVNLKVITFYGGLGYCNTETAMILSGNFPLPSPIAYVPYTQYNDSGVKKGTDFPKIDIKNFSGLRANVGFRLKLAVVTIHFDYTRAQYNVLTTGLGFSFR